MPGIIGTERTEPIGCISFSQSSSVEGASDDAHVDGYVRTRGKSEYTLPLGDNGEYKPLSIKQKSGLLDAAYYNTDPSVAITSKLNGENYGILPAGGPFDINITEENLKLVSQVEYWHIDGNAETQFTLHYDQESELEALTEGDPNRLTIVGWDGNMWQNIPSSTVTNLTEGTITANNHISPQDFKVISFGSLFSETENLGQISGVVWRDIDGNGERATDEPTYHDIELILTDCQNKQITTAYSDKNGYYSFSELGVGSYKVQFSNNNALLGVDVSLYQTTDPKKDNDFFRAGATACISVNRGATIDHIDLGLLSTCTIGDMVWNDINANGVLDPREQGIQDVTVRLMHGDSVIQTVTSNSSGNYIFDNVYPGNYHLQFDPIKNYDFTQANQGNDLAKDSDVDNSNGYGTTAIFSMNSGEVDLSWDLGLQGCIEISDYVWVDHDNNDIYSDGDTRINEVAVTLWRATNEGPKLVDTQISGSNGQEGQFSFCTIPGEYYLEFKLPGTQYEFVLAHQSNDPTVDSDVTHENGEGTTPIFELTQSSSGLNITAGLRSDSYVGTYVWQDRNRNGVRDLGEPGIEDITMKAYSINHDLVATTSTDFDGRYIFTGIPTGTYYLRIDLPEEYELTTANVGNDQYDSDFDNSIGRNTTGLFTLEEGLSQPFIDAGLINDECFFEPVNFTLRMGNGGIDIIWETTDEENIESYIIEKRSSEDEEFSELLSVKPENGKYQIYGISDEDYKNGEQYFYKVTAVYTNKEVCSTNPISISTPTAPIVLNNNMDSEILNDPFNPYSSQCDIAPIDIYIKMFDDQPQIIWVTEVEQNVSHYVIQRKVASENDYINIDTIMHESSDAQIYGILDKEDLQKTIYQYRLITYSVEGFECVSRVMNVNYQDRDETNIRIIDINEENIIPDDFITRFIDYEFADSFEGNQASMSELDEVESIDVSDHEISKKEIRVVHMYPNPTSDFTSIELYLDDAKSVEIYMFDLKGALIRTITNERYDKGTYNLRVPVYELPSGMYMISIKIDNTYIVRKLIKTDK